MHVKIRASDLLFKIKLVSSVLGILSTVGINLKSKLFEQKGNKMFLTMKTASSEDLAILVHIFKKKTKNKKKLSVSMDDSCPLPLVVQCSKRLAPSVYT